MNILANPDLGENRIEVKSRGVERLLGIQAEVSPDGAETRFALHFTNQAPFRCLLSHGEMPSVFTEIRHASALMLNRLELHIDHGADAMLELFQTAMRPAKTSVMIDPLTWDRLFLLQFFGHSPIALRVSALEAHEILLTLMQIAGKLSN